MYFARRIFFALAIVFWFDFFWGQIAIQFMISKIMVIFLQLAKPLDSNFANNLETFNEIANIFTLYLLLCFSDYVTSAEVRSSCGWFYIGIICLYALVHLSIIFRDSIKKVSRQVKKHLGCNGCCKVYSKAKRRRLEKVERERKLAEQSA